MSEGERREKGREEERLTFLSGLVSSDPPQHSGLLPLPLHQRSICQLQVKKS